VGCHRQGAAEVGVAVKYKEGGGGGMYHDMKEELVVPSLSGVVVDSGVLG